MGNPSRRLPVTRVTGKIKMTPRVGNESHWWELRHLNMPGGLRDSHHNPVLWLATGSSCSLLQRHIRNNGGNSLVVQWLGLLAFTAQGVGSVPGRGTKILPSASRRRKKIKNKKKETMDEAVEVS